MVTTLAISYKWHINPKFLLIKHLKSPFSCGFPVVFPWFSHGFPMIFPWFWCQFCPRNTGTGSQADGPPGSSASSAEHPPSCQCFFPWDFHGICNTWWLIPLSKWVITPVINGISRVNPLITGVITHLLSGMSHQVYINIHLFIYLFMYVFIFTYWSYCITTNNRDTMCWNMAVYIWFTMI